MGSLWIINWWQKQSHSLTRVPGWQVQNTTFYFSYFIFSQLWISTAIVYLPELKVLNFESGQNSLKQVRIGGKKVVLAKRSLFWRKEACFGEKRLVLAKRRLFWRKEGCFGEKKIVLAKRSLFWRKEGCFGEKKIVLAKTSPKNIKEIKSWLFWRN